MSYLVASFRTANNKIGDAAAQLLNSPHHVPDETNPDEPYQ